MQSGHERRQAMGMMWWGWLIEKSGRDVGRHCCKRTNAKANKTKSGSNDVICKTGV